MNPIRSSVVQANSIKRQICNPLTCSNVSPNTHQPRKNDADRGILAQSKTILSRLTKRISLTLERSMTARLAIFPNNMTEHHRTWRLQKSDLEPASPQCMNISTGFDVNTLLNGMIVDCLYQVKLTTNACLRGFKQANKQEQAVVRLSACQY